MSVESLEKGRKMWQSLTLEEKRQKRRDKIKLAIKCWEMNVHQAMSMNSIATQLDLHPARVSNLIDFAARRIMAHEHPDMLSIKMKETQRLDMLIDSVWKKILPGLDVPDSQLTEDQREDLKTYLELTKRKDKLLGLNAPVKIDQRIARVDVKKTLNPNTEGRLLALIQRLDSRGLASPEEKAFLKSRENTPVSNGNQKQLVEGGAIGSQVIDAEVVETKTLEPQPVDITKDQVTKNGELQLALFRTEEG